MAKKEVMKKHIAQEMAEFNGLGIRIAPHTRSLCGIESPPMYIDVDHAREHGVGDEQNICIRCQKLLRFLDKGITGTYEY